MMIEVYEEIRNMILSNPFNLKNIICDPSKGRKYLNELLKDLEQSVDSEENLIMKGFLSFFLDRREIAKAYFEKGVKINPQSTMCFAGLGVTYVNTNSALIFLRKAHKLAPKNLFILYNIGATYARRKKYIEAEHYHKEVLEADPYFIEAWCGLGRIYSLQEKFSDAESCLKKASEINPNYIEIYNIYGELNNSQKNYSVAESYFNKALKLDPQNIFVLLKLGAFYKQQSQVKKAVKFYKKVKELDPENKNATYYLNHLQNANIPQITLTTPKKTIRDHVEEGTRNLNNKKYKEAIKCYEKAIEIDPNLSIAWSNLGNVYSSLKKFKKAFNFHEKAVRLDEKSYIAWHNLGVSFHN